MGLGLGLRVLGFKGLRFEILSFLSFGLERRAVPSRALGFRARK